MSGFGQILQVTAGRNTNAVFVMCEMYHDGRYQVFCEVCPVLAQG